MLLRKPVVPNAMTMTPSEFKAHVGEPIILHDDPTHDRAGRHRRKSEQEKYLGL